MKALVQRVSQAAVDVEGERVAQIGPGMLVLLGVNRNDGPEQADCAALPVRLCHAIGGKGAPDESQMPRASSMKGPSSSPVRVAVVSGESAGAVT